MNRRGFLKAAAAVLPAAAVPASVAGAAAGESLMGGGALLGAAGAVGSVDVSAPWTIAGTIAAACYDALGRVNASEFARSEWLLEYRRHRIAARKGLTRREPAKLIWARKKLLDLRRKNSVWSNAPVRPNKAPRTQISALTGRRRDGRVKAALKRAGFVEWPWGGSIA